jgi:hypothetical protein
MLKFLYYRYFRKNTLYLGNADLHLFNHCSGRKLKVLWSDGKNCIVDHKANYWTE